MKKPNIGIIGRGFVGQAVAFGFSEQTGYEANLRIFDKDKSKSLNTIDEVVTQSDFIFISVPTPSNADGSINLQVLEDCLEDLYKTAKSNDAYQAIYLIRSTVGPGTTRKLQSKFNKLKIVFNPEFLERVLR